MKEEEILDLLQTIINTTDGKDYYADSVKFLAENVLDYINSLNMKYKNIAKDILQSLYELCKVRGQIQWDDIWFLVIRYGVIINE